MFDIRYPNGAKTDEEKIASIVTNLSKLDDTLSIYLMRYFGGHMPYEKKKTFYDKFVNKLDFMQKVEIVKNLLDNPGFKSIRKNFKKNAQRLAEIRNVICHEPKFILNDEAYETMPNFEWPEGFDENLELEDRDKPISSLYDEFVMIMQFFKDFIGWTNSGEDIHE